MRRPRVPRDCPAHVTLRLRTGVPSLRTRRFATEFRRSLREASERGSFRVVHYSIQRTHLHLLVEAAGKEALGRGTPPPSGLDAASSRPWFDGWRSAPRAAPGDRAPLAPEPSEPREVSPPRTWLLARGWRRHGLIDLGEIPGARRGR